MFSALPLRILYHVHHYHVKGLKTSQVEITEGTFGGSNLLYIPKIHYNLPPEWVGDYSFGYIVLLEVIWCMQRKTGIKKERDAAKPTSLSPTIRRFYSPMILTSTRFRLRPSNSP